MPSGPTARSLLPSLALLALGTGCLDFGNGRFACNAATGEDCDGGAPAEDGGPPRDAGGSDAGTDAGRDAGPPGDASVPVTVTLGTGGGGTVTSTPGGVFCPPTCSAQFLKGTQVALLATPSLGSVFDQWGGACAADAGEVCRLAVDGPKAVVAQFATSNQLFTLTVARAIRGTATGTVLSSPPGINCGLSCSASFLAGQTVTLTAEPGAGFFREGWSGSCAGTDASCTVNMGMDRMATAIFTPANRVFVTSTQVVAGALGGLAKADALCMAAAADAGLPGPFVAWLSTSTVDAKDRLLPGHRGWLRPDGKPFVDSLGEVLQGRASPYYPPRLNERGAPVDTAWALTGTGPAGTATQHCNDWTDAGGMLVYGQPTHSSADWTFAASTGCTAQGRLICFQTSYSAVIPAPTRAGRFAFFSEGKFNPSSGIPAADGLCKAEAADAGLPGSYLALLATPVATAASRFLPAGTPWVRTDGVPVAATAAAFLSGADWDVGISKTARQKDGAYFQNRAWVGAADVNALGTGTSCASWTGAAGSGAAWEVNGTVHDAAEVRSTSCGDTTVGLFCLQE